VVPGEVEGGGGDGERERRAGREEGEHDGEVAALDGDEQRGHRGPEPVHVEEHLQRERERERERVIERSERKARREGKKERKREREHGNKERHGARERVCA
jgi:hypothetical protein